MLGTHSPKNLVSWKRRETADSSFGVSPLCSLLLELYCFLIDGTSQRPVQLVSTVIAS